MGTGKELARLVSCKAWKNHLKGKDYLCWWQIFDDAGTPISPTKAKDLVFCHIRILLNRQKVEAETVKVLAAYLNSIASTRSEFMVLAINEDYHFFEIVIS